MAKPAKVVLLGILVIYKNMHKNFGRFFALTSIAALTIFAGKTFAESRQQPLFAETPVIEQEVSRLAMNVPGNDVSVEDDDSVLPVKTPAAAQAEETIHSTQVSPVNTNVNSNPADTMVASNGTQHFSITKKAGDDEDEDEDRDENDD